MWVRCAVLAQSYLTRTLIVHPWVHYVPSRGLSRGDTKCWGQQPLLQGPHQARGQTLGWLLQKQRRGGNERFAAGVHVPHGR